MKRLIFTRRQILRAIAIATACLYFASAHAVRAQIVATGDGNGNVSLSGTANIGPGTFSGYYYNTTTTPPLAPGGTLTLVPGTQISETVNNNPNNGQYISLVQTGVGATVNNNGQLTFQGSGSANLVGTVLMAGISNGAGGTVDATVNNLGSVATTITPNGVVPFERAIGIRETQTGSGNLTIHNSGSVSGTGTNSGSGYASNYGIRAQTAAGNITITNDATKSITASSTNPSAGTASAYGVVAISNTGNATVTNNGTINSTISVGGTVGTSSTSVSGIYAHASTVNVTNGPGSVITAAATVSGNTASSAYSFGIRAASTTATPVMVRNDGSITASGSGYNLGIYLSTPGTVYNTGSVTSTNAAIYVPTASLVTLAKSSPIIGIIAGGGDASSTSTLNFMLDVPSNIFVATKASLDAQIATYELAYAAAAGAGTVEQVFSIDMKSYDVENFQTVLDNLVSIPVDLSLNGLTPNQMAIANNLNQGLDGGNPGPLALAVFNVAVNNPAILGDVLDQLSPEQFARFASTTAFNNADFEVEAMDNYLAGHRLGPQGTFAGGNGGIDSSGLTVNDPSYLPGLAAVHSRLLAWNAAPVSSSVISDSPAMLLGGVELRDSKDMKSMAEPVETNPWNFFVRGNVILAQGFSELDINHFDENTESVTLGADYRISPNFLIGVTGNYGHTDVTLDPAGSSATVDSYSPGLYAAFADEGWYANLIGDYLHNAYTQTRVISFLGQNASSAPEGNEGVVDLDGGYDFHRGAFTFGPISGLQYTHLTVDGYQESGSIADLNVNEDQSDSLRSRLGGRGSYQFSRWGISFTPHLDASWVHEYMDQSRGVTSQFSGEGLGSFSVKTNNPSRDFALVNLGLDGELNRMATVFLDYTVQAGQDDYFGQSVQAGVKIGF
jgi:uncharacterized protein YhjY with autotransporter beta-barrel domain